MACSRRSSSTRSAGFVLAVTLWMLAGMAVVVGLISLWALEEVRAASEQQANLDEQLLMVGTRDTVLYLAATRDLTLAGLPVVPLAQDEFASRRLEEFGALRRDPVGGELLLDGTLYLGLPGIDFSIQDEAGLVSLVWPRDYEVDRFLQSQRVPSAQVPGLRDALLDYVDEDQLSRLAGAEAREYERAGRAAPPDRRLLLPMELLGVWGWSELPAETRRLLPQQVTTTYSGPVNLNTAPPDLLPTWIAGCPATCDMLLLRRSQKPFINSVELQTQVGVTLPGDDGTDYRYMASDALRLTFSGSSGAALRMHVRLTPLADQKAPWSIIATYPVPRPASNATPKSTDSPLFADPSPDRS